MLRSIRRSRSSLKVATAVAALVPLLFWQILQPRFCSCSGQFKVLAKLHDTCCGEGSPKAERPCPPAADKPTCCCDKSDVSPDVADASDCCDEVDGSCASRQCCCAFHSSSTVPLAGPEKLSSPVAEDMSSPAFGAFVSSPPARRALAASFCVLAVSGKQSCIRLCCWRN